MLKNYLKIALRNFVKNKVYSGITVMGLAVGMAGTIIIFQLVAHHLSVDRYHRKADRTYRVVVDLHLDDGSVEKERGSAYILHQTLKNEFSSVEHAAYLAHKEVTVAVGSGEDTKRFLEKEAAAFIGSDWFEIFDYEWMAGGPSALDVPNQVVLTERYAQKYFGTTDALGKYLTLDRQEKLLVAGVLRDYTGQTDFKKDIFVSLPTLKKLVPTYGYEDWGWINSGRETYITLRSEQDKAAFEQQMPAFARKYYGADGKIFWYHLQELSDVHFNADYGGKIKYSTVALLGMVGLLLVLIACFNFINLTTAQSFKRSREVGIRKVLGVSQRQVFWLFMQETTLYTFVAFLLSLVLASVLTLLLRDWLSVALPDLDVFGSTFLLFVVLLLVAIVLLAGLYPALVISHFNPLRAIRGLAPKSSRSGLSVRKGLVVAKFSISFVLIAVSLVVIRQSNYIRNKDLGLKSPEAALNRKLLVGDADKTGIIVGVLTDFNNTDLYSGIEPTVVFSAQRLYRHAAIKLTTLHPSTLDRIQAIWQKQYPKNVFEAGFYDDEIARFYQREELASRLTTTFALLSVLLSCLGLLGLAIFSTEQRIKEIGVRKVLGASVASILVLVSRDFIRLVVVASVIASPVAYYFMHRWLADFTYRIDIAWWMFGLAGLLAAGIALLTVSFQSVKAALMNPVESLRGE